jgi:hypothetical protein
MQSYSDMSFPQHYQILQYNIAQLSYGALCTPTWLGMLTTTAPKAIPS